MTQPDTITTTSLMATAVGLLTDDDENGEYDRALVEVLLDSMHLGGQNNKPGVAAMLRLIRDANDLPVLVHALWRYVQAIDAYGEPRQLSGSAATGWLVEWVVDVEADQAATPREAAQYARNHQTRPGTTATCFRVTNRVTDEVTDVDLNA